MREWFFYVGLWLGFNILYLRYEYGKVKFGYGYGNLVCFSLVMLVWIVWVNFLGILGYCLFVFFC